jgi:hypothetical protein
VRSHCYTETIASQVAATSAEEIEIAAVVEESVCTGASRAKMIVVAGQVGDAIRFVVSTGACGCQALQARVFVLYHRVPRETQSCKQEKASQRVA